MGRRPARRPLVGSGWVTAVAAAVLALLLALLAGLQYHWTSALARASEERAMSSVGQAASAFAGDFDHELLRLLLQFRDVDRGEVVPELARRTNGWRRQALYPEILRGVFLVHRDDGGAATLQALDERSGTMRPASWPAELQPLRDDLARTRGADAPPWPGPGASGLPAWLVPLQPRDGDPRWADHAPAPADFALLWIDTQALRRELLPALAERHFGGEVDYRIEVRDQRGTLLYARGATVPGGRPDVRVPLFRLALAERFHHRAVLRHDARGAGMPNLREPPPPPSGLWTLSLTHPAGSLAAAAERVRRHNLGMSLTAIALLAAAIALVVLTARRAQALARRQIELVAGVSHELLTPVAALRSAGENLAAGVVTEPEKVRAYGDLVERESRRLGALVDQVLTWAGLQARGEPAVRQPVDAAALVESVTRACAAEARRAGVRVETRVEESLPPLEGDPSALERALRNLVENALRHGGEGGWVGVGATALDGAALRGVGARAGVALWVEDRGPGIDAAELRHLFEPFRRGKRSLEAGIPGSGLGLALARQIAEAHGGRLRATAAAARGMRFTLELPEARPERAIEPQEARAERGAELPDARAERGGAAGA